ncbi:MAG: hypothetical protein WAW88_17895 [Nocardioides sp.]
MYRLKSFVSALLIGLVLVTAVDYAASAATGAPFLLGRFNQANQTTTLKNTGSGPAAKFVSGEAPIAVSNSRRVPKLNADQVDGKHAADLGVRTTLYEADFSFDDASGFQVFLDDVPQGRYLGTFGGYFFGPNDGGSIECFVVGTKAPAPQTMNHNHQADGPEHYYTLAGADVVVVSKTQDLIARCTGSTYDWFGTVRVSLTPIDTLSRVTAQSGPA